jgi:hypothetical protein
MKSMRIVEDILAALFPPSLPALKIPEHKFSVKWTEGIEPEDFGDGILWRAYDVRTTGIERMMKEII